MTLEDVFEISGDSALADAMREFHEGLFSNRRTSPGDDTNKRLINALERLRATRAAARPASGLAPLYPTSLSD